ncbi:MAG: tetratricopeptide repeat protein [Acidobacteriota bacterium]
MFNHAARLKKFLEYIVTEAIAGHLEELKEYVIGVEVFDKKSSFDPRTDPIVRVQARRLRSLLERYYQQEGCGDDLVIDLPKGGYRPVFKVRDGIQARRPLSVAVVSSNTIAVVPFLDYSREGDLGYFCNGLREEVIDSLTKLPNFRIVASDVMPSRDTHDPNGNRLIPGMIVRCSVRRADSGVRVTAQLIEAASGCYLWSESVDAQLDNTYATQKEIAQKVLHRLQQCVAASSGRARLPRPTLNLAARNLYLQGRYHLNQRTEESMRKAVELFEKSLAEDSQFAPAHSGLADAYSLLGHYGLLAPAEVWTKAASSASLAVILDDSSVEARTTFAHLKATQDWDWTTAEQEFRQAIGLDRTYATAHHWYAMSCLIPLGRLDEALTEVLTAHSLDPVSPVISRDVALVYWYRREFDFALEQCDQAVELNPHFPTAFWTLGLVQEQRGDYHEAAAAFQQAIHLAPDNARMRAALARLFAVSGQRKLSFSTLKRLDQLREHRYVSPFDFASIDCALGRSDSAFKWLDRACKDRCFELLSIDVDPRFDVIRNHPRFPAVGGRDDGKAAQNRDTAQ